MAGRWSADWSLLFLSLHWNVRMLAFGRPLPLVLALQLGRFALVAGVLAAIALRRLAAAARRCRHPCGTSGRRAIWGADVIESPLAMKTLFTVGPVPITEPVVTTWLRSRSPASSPRARSRFPRTVTRR
jgi:hypothetical protein